MQPQGSAAALSDAGLVERARRRDPLAFRTIMERNNQRLYRIARAILKDEAEAEDVVQESYLRAFEGLAQFREESMLSTWLTRITINEALGRKRKRRETVGVEAIEAAQQASAQIIRFPNMSVETDPERGAMEREVRQLLERSIDALPEPFRVVFVMRDIEELSIEETAALLAIRPATVKTRLHRARRLLRQSLDREMATTLKTSFPFAGARCARITEAVLSRMKLNAP
jgi:RNA polymerase sigma-70 factor (ECF subfamily)